MNLYLLIGQLRGYDTFDSCIVAAESEEQAKNIDPYNNVYPSNYWGSAWAKNPEEVTAELIGMAVNGTVSGVILASFNAG